MDQNNSLKIAIVNSFKTTSLTDSIEILATEIILYKFLIDVLNNDSVNTNDVQSLVNTYKSQYEYSFSNLKNKYLSYQKIYVFLKNISANNLLGVSDTDISYVYKLYLDNSLIVNFDTESFNIKMYNTDSVDNNEYVYLKNIHYNVMCPISRYYNKIYGADISNMKIVSSTNIENNIGKRIDFVINGINPFIILNDIKHKKINIKYYDIFCEYPNIVLINM